MTTRNHSIAALAVAALLLAAVDGRAQLAGRVAIVSTDSAGNEGDGASGRGSVSADGRFVAFDSAATNLVPGDTNDNTDVFVHDTQTGVVQRVSLAWNGMEARDDSSCPAISDDGRHVAFKSRAWNMYPGGANLGRPRWDVYVHDRQTGTTTPVSRAVDGGDPDGDSECPSISADGRRVAFSSRAGNLVANDGRRNYDVFLYDLDKKKMKLISKRADGGSGSGDSREAALSADGNVVAFISSAIDLDGFALPVTGMRRVFLRDIVAGKTELIDFRGQNPTQTPNGSAWDVAISADGNVVAYATSASNLTVPAPPQPGNGYVYARIRSERRTVLVSREDPLLDDCDRGPGVSRCFSSSSDLPDVSADGRYVSFTSYSQRLLPASYNGAPQAYVFDMLGGRLRRVSVDETGEPGGCSGETSLSRDGRILAVANDGGLIPQANGRRDVYKQDWRCLADGRCRSEVACPPKPTTCAPATSALFRLRKHPPLGINEDRVFWRWSGEGADAPPPDPTNDARYQLCVYGGPTGAVVMDVGTPLATTCPAGSEPCWRQRGAVWKLQDGRGALRALTVYGGRDASRIIARGQGALLDAPYLPLTGTSGLTVQLQDRTTGRCWGADFPATAIKKNFAGVSVSGSRRDGWLVAELR